MDRAILKICNKIIVFVWSIKDVESVCMVRLYLTFLVITAFLANAHAYTCSQCPNGKFKSVIANDACIWCPRDTYTETTGHTNENECQACPANSMTVNPWGAPVKEDCVCKPGFRGPNGGPCFPCEAGKYSDEAGTTGSCKTCPENSFSPVQSDAITDCECIPGYTGPYGGPCEKCAVNTYKTMKGDQACTTCAENTMTLGEGKTNKDACVCTPGYTASGGGGQALSSSVCLRFLALWSIPSFGTMSAKQSGVTLSPVPPVYFATGGPSGGGYVSFQDEMYLRKEGVVVSPKANGGITLTMVMRLGADKSTLREDVFALNLNGGFFRVWVTPAEGKITAITGDEIDAFAVVHATTTDVTQWMRITVTYNTVSLVLSMTINDATPTTAQGHPGMFSDGTLVNGPVLSMFIGSSSSVFSVAGFYGDVAGVFFVDELLSNNAITAIQNKMMNGIDLTPLCSSGGDMVCIGCLAGKFKVDPGPAACTNCGVQKYSTAVAATSAETCAACPANTVSDVGSAMIEACTCNTGYTGADGHECSACELGQYKEATGSASCTDCGKGKYSGFLAMKTAETCLSCPANSLTRLTGNDVIEDCECNAGYTGPNGGHCTACVPGKYKLTPGSHECTSCAADTYSTIVASKTGADCQKCPAFSEAPEGSGVRAACVCKTGYTGKGGSQTGVSLSELPPGSEFMPPELLAQLVDAPCKACVAGKFKETTGSEACTNCLANTYSTAVAATSNVCVGCAADMQSGVASDESIDCKCNKGYTGQDGTTCSACEAGTYKTSVGSASCANCAKDTYSTDVAKTTSTCASCPSYSQSLAGSNELIDCKCNAGYSGQDGQTCTACGSGQYKPEVGAAICSYCPENHYQPEAAKTALSDCQSCGPNSLSPIANALQGSCQCAPGYTGPNGGVCVECYMGKFKPLKGAQDCTLCPNATYSGGTAQTSADTCLHCPGFSRSWMGSSARSDCHCDFGYFTVGMGTPESSCSKCAAGTFNDRLNQETCSKCPAGKFSEVDTATSAETCQICPVGFSADGQSQCDACPGNSETLEPGAAYLQDCKCNAGYTGADGSTCVHCGPGKYKEEKGSAECTNCRADTYSAELANEFESDCNGCDSNAQAPEGSDSRDDCKCKVGWTSKIAGLDGEMCVECSAGKFKDKIGHAVCDNCPENTYRPYLAGKGYYDCAACFPDSRAPAGSTSLENCECILGYERT